MIAVDAGVLIAHLQAGWPQATRAVDILTVADDHPLHPLTLAECAVGPANTGESATFRRAAQATARPHRTRKN